MSKFPVDVPKGKVIKTLARLGFRLIRDEQHISMLRENPDGSKTPLTMPNHRTIKGSTLRAICTQSGIPREEFLEAYRDA
jgi:predicted RNA binding protein YcfA (HicA-like mRNA interferase family)